MPVKPPHVTAMDLVRARQIVQSLTPLKGLSGEDAEFVAKTIAQCFAKGREQGLQSARDALTNSAIADQLLSGGILPKHDRLRYWLGSTKEEGDSA